MSEQVAAEQSVAPEQEDFVTRAERALAEVEKLRADAAEEAERVLDDLRRLRFRADQITRVFRALKLEPPREVRYFAEMHALAERHEAEEEALEVIERVVPPVETPTAWPAGEQQPEPPRAIASDTPSTIPAPPPEEPAAPAAPEVPPAAPAPPKAAAPAAVPGDETRTAILEKVRSAGRSGLSLREIWGSLGLQQTTVSDHLRALKDGGEVKQTGRPRTKAARWVATKFPVGENTAAAVRHAKAEEEFEREAVEEAGRAARARDVVAVVPSPEQLARLRDYVTAQRQPFTVAQAVEATEVPEPIVRGALSALIERQAVRYVGMDDLELYEYVKPSGPGRAAEVDAARQNGNGAAREEGSLPVEGTGQRIRSSHHETDKLLARAAGLGARIRKTGNDHFVVENPATGQRTRIGGTPGADAVPKSRKALQNIGLSV